MKKTLIAYTTNSGSTEDIARKIAEELGKNGAPVDLARLEHVQDLTGYEVVLVGAPMILGWHRAARKFVKEHQVELSKAQVAFFAAAMSLTRPAELHIDGVPVYLDPGLAKAPARPGRLSFRENYALPVNYFQPVLKSAPQVKPASIAFFGGKLELFRLPLLQMLFVMLVVQAQPGDLRNWTAVREWAGDIRSKLVEAG